MRLTPAHYKIYCLSKSGFSTREIAQRLDKPHRTVAEYLCRMYKVLGVHSKEEMDSIPRFLITEKEWGKK